MSFLSSESILQKLSTSISDFNPARIKHGAYELSLGHEVFITNENIKRTLGENQQLSIPPGQFALLITKEIITVPTDLLAFISIKYKYKSKGLVNVSGFHVDPGFEGRLKFSVYNAGAQNIILECGKPIFLIWFASFDQATKKYDGDHQNQLSITNSDVMDIQGDVVSPHVLKEQMTVLKHQVDNYKQITVIAISILVAFFSLLLSQNSGCDCASVSQPLYKVPIDTTKYKILPKDSLLNQIKGTNQNQ